MNKYCITIATYKEGDFAPTFQPYFCEGDSLTEIRLKELMDAEGGVIVSCIKLD